MKLWWLSFVDDTGFLGVCIVEAPTFIGAIKESWARNCNPGGEVSGEPIDFTPEDNRAKYYENVNILMSQTQLKEKGFPYLMRGVKHGRD